MARKATFTLPAPGILWTQEIADALAGQPITAQLGSPWSASGTVLAARLVDAGVSLEVDVELDGETVNLGDGNTYSLVTTPEHLLERQGLAPTEEAPHGAT